MDIDDMLNGACRISAINSVSALSKFLKKPIAIDGYSVYKGPIKMAELNENFKGKIVSLYFPINGNLSGSSFAFYTDSSAKMMCNLLIENGMKDKENNDLVDENISALAEISNIILGNFLTSFSQILGISFLIHQVAIVDCGYVNDILSKVLQSNKIDTSLLMFCVTFSYKEMRSCLLIMFNEKILSDVIDKFSADHSKDLSNAS